jgi:GxxExxY protein
MELLHEELTNKIIKCFYNVFNVLGYGFLEKVYHNALLLELRSYGLEAISQGEIIVFYNGTEVGHYYADIIVEDRVILEIKVAKTIIEAHEAQLLNYLRATDKEVGLVLNFGPKAEFKRKVFENKYKK